MIFFLQYPDLLKKTAQVQKKYPAMMVMPHLDYWEELAQIEEIFGQAPLILHTGIPFQMLVKMLHERGIKVFANILYQERVPVLAETTALQMRRKKVDFVQTENPLWLRKLLFSNR